MTAFTYQSGEAKPSLLDLKGALSLSEIVEETCQINRSGKVLCPAHDDHTPSCHIYPDSWYCFSCGANGDVFDWLELVHDLPKAAAIEEATRRASGLAQSAVALPVRKPEVVREQVRPISEEALTHHLNDYLTLSEVPAAMRGRGFDLDALQRLGFAVYGSDVVFPVTGPTGDVLALKRRYAKPVGGVRYRYTTPGHGAPAWCSLGFSDRSETLIIEGELNGMACWLARPQLAVMAAAGTNGMLHLQAFKDKTVYVYGDADEVGQTARDRWAQQALDAGALRVFVLEAWEQDACDIVGKYGLEELARRLK